MMSQRLRSAVDQLVARHVRPSIMSRARGVLGHPEDAWNHFRRCFDFLVQNDVAGEVLEFGVFTGRSLSLMLDASDVSCGEPSDAQRAPHRFFGFDSFEGLPPVERDGHRFHGGQFACDEDRVRENLSRWGAETERVTLVPGYYESSLTEETRIRLGITEASMIHVDCDLYPSALTALRWCRPFIHQGTIISFDDWHCYKSQANEGEQRAFAEFMSEAPELSATPFSSTGWHGAAFVMHRS